jgi:hypothetical protein
VCAQVKLQTGVLALVIAVVLHCAVLYYHQAITTTLTEQAIGVLP